MYEQYFHLTEAPFTIAPNPHYLYLSEQHREALAHLTYGLKDRNGSFIVLTGEVGTGKTTVCRCLIEQVPEDVHLAIILNPRLSEAELLETICREFDVKYIPGSTVNALIDRLNGWLLKVHGEGWHAAIIVEEAQNLSIDVLEQLRLLTNLETNEQKLLQIILIGQPELLQKLEQPELRQLSQRIIARYHLRPLNHGEVRAYIAHRLEVAHGSPHIFPPAAMLRIAQLSKGIPRLINLLCDRALLGCYVQDQETVGMKTVQQAANEVFGKKHRTLSSMYRSPVWVALAAVAALLGGAYWFGPAVSPSLQARQDASDASASAALLDVATDNSIATQAPQLLPDVMTDNFDSAEVATLPRSDVLQDDGPSVGWERLVQGHFGELSAYVALFNSWQIDATENSGFTPCEVAHKRQLDCWHSSGRFNDIQRMNRPVVLKLLSRQGRAFHVTLLAVLSDNEWEIGVGKQTLALPRSQIERLWTGEYTVLWRRPDGFIRTMRPGDKNQTVTWLSNQLALIEGREVSQSSPLAYDALLMAKVRRLQRRCGLQVDGLLGRETIMMINTINAAAPVLTDKRLGSCPRRLHV